MQKVNNISQKPKRTFAVKITNRNLRKWKANSIEMQIVL